MGWGRSKMLGGGGRAANNPLKEEGGDQKLWELLCGEDSHILQNSFWQQLFFYTLPGFFRSLLNPDRFQLLEIHFLKICYFIVFLRGGGFPDMGISP